MRSPGFAPRAFSMDKIEWLSLLAKHNKSPLPTQPFSAQELPGTYVLYSTDRSSIIRVPCSKEDHDRLHLEDKYLVGFFETMKGLYDGTVFKGQLDALLLKELAGPAFWSGGVNNGHVRLDGAYFSKSVLARALAGWEDPDAILARSAPKSMKMLDIDGNKISISDKKKEGVHPLLLHGRHALVIVGAAYFEEGEEPEEPIEFPDSAIAYNA
jgi:hypothetical protein